MRQAMRRRHGPFRWTGGILAGGLLVAALLPGMASAEGTLRRGLIGTVATLDPQKATTASETALVLDLFEGLVRRDGAGRLVPGAASAWTVSPDGLTYSFTLREGGRWSNGDPVKASDFVAAFRRLFDPATGAPPDGPLQMIANAGPVRSGFAKPDTLGVTAEKDGTLTIRLDRPTPTFLDRLASPAALPVNTAAARKAAPDYATGARLVSNGAYMIAPSRARTGYALARNPRAAEASAIDGVVYRPFENAAACLAAFKAAEIDICPDVPTENLAALRTEFGPELSIARYAGTSFYAVNTRRKPFDDPRIRRALSLAIDRDALAAKAWSGGMLPAVDLVPPELSAAPPVAPAPLADRQAQARMLLSAAGFGPGNPLKLTLRIGSGLAHEQAAALVAADWAAIGVTATVEPSSGGAHFAELSDGGDFDLAWSGWIADEPDALDMLEILKTGGRYNFAGYTNPGFDRLIEAADTGLDPARRAADLAQAEALIRQDMPVIPLLSYAALSLVAPRVTGWSGNLLDQHPSRTLGLSQ